MKYRIIDPVKREVVRRFFNLEEFDLEEGDVLDVRLYSKLRGGLNPVPLLLEPVPELAEGWHPYPDEKPEKADEPYLVAYKSDGGDEIIYFSFFDGEVFELEDSNLFAWKEMPKIWKE